MFTLANSGLYIYKGFGFFHCMGLHKILSAIVPIPWIATFVLNSQHWIEMSDKISMNSDCKERRYYSVTWQVLIFSGK